MAENPRRKRQEMEFVASQVVDRLFHSYSSRGVWGISNLKYFIALLQTGRNYLYVYTQSLCEA
jgi:hypothetical protein